MTNKPDLIKFIEEPYDKYRLMKYLEEKLDRAGLASVDVQRTPQLTRILLQVLNPARVIGKRGRLIDELTQDIKEEFHIKDPQISVSEIVNPALEPRIIGKRAAKYIEMGKKVRSVLHFFLRDILKAGAMGAEIVASGKIGQKGARAKTLRVSAGYIPKAGDVVNLVKEAHISAKTRSGIIGILVRIVPPGTVFPDKIVAEAIPLPKVVEAAEAPEVSDVKSNASEVKAE